MRPTVEVTMSCRSEGCDGRVHLSHRGGSLKGTCDRCGEAVAVALPGHDGRVRRRRLGPPLAAIAS